MTPRYTPGLGLRAPLVLSLLVVAGSAPADDLDRAFGAQRKPAQQEVRVERNVGDAAQASREGVIERATAREEARRREMARLPQRAPAENGGEKTRRREAPATASTTPATPAVRDATPSRGIERVKEWWPLKGEMKSITVRCPHGRERSYEYHVKTGRFCTPMLTCDKDEFTVQRAVCS